MYPLGNYLIAVSGITLPANKVAIFMSNWTGRFSLGGQIVTTTKIEVEQFNQGSGAYIDDIKAGASVEIRIYS